MITRIVAVAGRRALILGFLALVTTLAGAALRMAGASEIVIFIVTAVALASLAAVVAEATDQLGARLGPGATGVIQSALGNLPELFISIFALRAGLVVVVQTALIGSILANTLLVLGLAFLIGGARHGPQRFGTGPSRVTAMLLVLSVASLAIPTLATAPGAPDFGHPRAISLITAVVLLAVFASSVPMAVRGSIGPGRPHRGGGGGATGIIGDAEGRAGGGWTLGACIAVLVIAGIGAALVSDWFVDALRPAMASLRLSESLWGW